MLDISIIIPIYNVETYLGACLDSVKEMGKQLQIEILLIDDGSTDNSSVIAKEYADKYPHFYYHRQENRGLSCARNYGASLAKGKYLMFVDSDDTIDAKVYVRMFHAAQKNQTELTICDVVRLKDEKIISSARFLYLFHNLDKSVTHLTKHTGMIYDTPAWNKLILRSFYEKHQFAFPEEYYYEDAPWSIALHYYANAVTVLNEVGYYWRVRTEGAPSITQLRGEKKNLCDLLEMLERRFVFAKTYIKNKKIQLELEQEIGRLSFVGYMKLFETMDKDKSREYLELIARFIEKWMSKEGYERLPVINQQLMQSILERDIEKLIRVYRSKREIYKTASILDAKKEYRIDPPGCRVDAIHIDKNGWVLDCHLYYRKVIGFEKGQKVQAFLYHIVSGKKIKVPTKSIECRWLTEDQATTGFQIKLDFEKIEKKKLEEGFYKILVVYRNAVMAGKRILDGIREGEKKAIIDYSFQGRKKQIKSSIDVKKTIQFEMKK